MDKKKQRKSLPNGEAWNQAQWANARRRAIASKEAICALCNKFIDVHMPMNDPETGKRNMLSVEVDHIVPTSRGGALYDLDNLQLAHTKCNRQKGAKMSTDYDALKPDRPPVPLSNNW